MKNSYILRVDKPVIQVIYYRVQAKDAYEAIQLFYEMDEGEVVKVETEGMEGRVEVREVTLEEYYPDGYDNGPTNQSIP